MTVSKVVKKPSTAGSTDTSVQSLRGLAVILMVAGHVIGSSATSGMTIGDDSIWRYAYVALEDVRMPLFTVLSGFVYAMRPVITARHLPQLLKAKIRRLLVPLLTVGTLLIALQTQIPGTNSKPGFDAILGILVFPPGHLWFLQSIFLIFLVIATLECTNLITTPIRWAGCLAVSFACAQLFSSVFALRFFSIDGAIGLIPFFILGYGLARFTIGTPSNKWLMVTSAVFVVVYALRLSIAFHILPPINDDLARFLGLCVGALATYLLMAIRERISIFALAWVGTYSFGIYLLHVFGSAGSRMALDLIPINVPNGTVFAVGLLAGVMLPIAFELTFGRNRAVSVAILGQRS